MIDAREPHVLEMFDRDDSGTLVCRVCGSLVAGKGDYPQAHGDWHETSDGA